MADRRYPDKNGPTSSPAAMMAWALVDDFDVQTVQHGFGPALTFEQRCLLAGQIAGAIVELTQQLKRR